MAIFYSSVLYHFAFVLTPPNEPTNNKWTNQTKRTNEWHNMKLAQTFSRTRKSDGLEKSPRRMCAGDSVRFTCSHVKTTVNQLITICCLVFDLSARVHRVHGYNLGWHWSICQRCAAAVACPRSVLLRQDNKTEERAMDFVTFVNNVQFACEWDCSFGLVCCTGFILYYYIYIAILSHWYLRYTEITIQYVLLKFVLSLHNELANNSIQIAFSVVYTRIRCWFHFNILG